MRFSTILEIAGLPKNDRGRIINDLSEIRQSLRFGSDFMVNDINYECLSIPARHLTTSVYTIMVFNTEHEVYVVREYGEITKIVDGGAL